MPLPCNILMSFAYSVLFYISNYVPPEDGRQTTKTCSGF